MSQTPVQPDPQVARAVGASLFGGVLMTDVLGLPRGFDLESYLGVLMILGGLLAWFGSVWLLVDDRDRVWWYGLAEGTLITLGWVMTRVFGLPVTRGTTAGEWGERTALLMLFFAVNLVILSGWVLRARRRGRHVPVVSARDREWRR